MAGIRSIRFIAPIAGLLAVLLALYFFYYRPKVDRETAAIVNDSIILKTDVQTSLDNLLVHFRSMGMQIDSAHVDSLRSRVLDSMITSELLYQESRKAEIQVTEEDVSKEIDAIIRQHPSEQEFQESLAKQGLTVDKLRRELNRSLTIRRYVDEQIAKPIVVSPEEQLQYYDAHRNDYRHDEQVAARHIVIQTAENDPPESLQSKRRRLESVRQRALSGEEFTALAKEHSEDPVASQGGDIGYFSRGMMVKPFEEAAFSMKTGAVSDVIQTQYGFHIIQLYDRRPAGTSSFEEVKGSIEEVLKRERINREIEALVQKLKGEAEIEIKL